MRVLVTRPRGQAERLAALLAARGVESLVEPLIAIRPAGAGPLPLEGVQALVFTSANGVEAFAAREGGRALPVFAIGERTAEAARRAGFEAIESAQGAVAELAALLRARLDPAKGALLHAAGADVAGDLPALLAPQGYEIRRIVLYEAVAAKRFSGAAVAALREGLLDAVLLFSPRTAATFVSLAEKAGLASACARLDAVCLSQAVADAASALAWHAVLVAARPEQSVLVELLAPRKDASLAPVEAQDRVVEDQGVRVLGIDPFARRNGVGSKEAQLSEKPDQAESAKTAAPPPPAPRRPRNLRLALWLGLPVALIVLLMLGLPYWGPLAGLGRGDDGAALARVNEQAARLARIEAKLDGLDGLQKAAPSLLGLPEELAQSERKLAALEHSYAELAARPEPKPAIDATQLAALADQLAALKLDITKLGTDMDAMRTRLAALEDASKKTVASDMRQAAFVLALGQLRAALAERAPYGQALDTVALLAAGDDAAQPALAALKEHATSGIPTLGALQSSYDAASLAAARAAMAADRAGLLGRIWARLRQLVVVRRIDGEDAGDGTDAVLARAGARLSAGDLKSAVEALAALKGNPAEAMAPWLADARARLAAEAALDSLGARAIAHLGEAKP